jgi:hypothetical protein
MTRPTSSDVQADSHVTAYRLRQAAQRRRQRDIARADRRFDKFERLSGFSRG